MIKLLLIFTLVSPSSIWALETLSIPSQYSDLTQIEGQLIGLDSAGTRYTLKIVEGKLESSMTVDSSRPSRPDDILSDGLVTSGRGPILKAWLGGPTDRYDHGVIADSIEASRLYAQSTNRETVFLELPANQVFEDRLVRHADLDGDKLEELIVIRTHLRTGAGIASFGFDNGQLKLEAASDTIGLSHRWLNIVGIEDFTGDGNLEIAAVITPHIGGTLTLYQQKGTRLIPIIEQWGYSNHEYGSRELGMSAVLDINNDGIMDMAVPNENRHDLILFTVKDRAFQTLARIKHKSSINSGIYSMDIDRDSELELVYLLKDGALIIVEL
jgi:hypothetical protein